MNPLLYTILIGAVAGWLAGFFVKGVGYGIIGNVIVGVIGSSVGNWLLGALGVSFGQTLVGQILTGAVGAAALMFVIGLVRGKSS
jgi:uncharacterized membrane protein YeaQ/YmgE (transglycosylase-associated protein family)